MRSCGSIGGGPPHICSMDPHHEPSPRIDRQLPYLVIWADRRRTSSATPAATAWTRCSGCRSAWPGRACRSPSSTRPRPGGEETRPPPNRLSRPRRHRKVRVLAGQRPWCDEFLCSSSEASLLPSVLVVRICVALCRASCVPWWCVKTTAWWTPPCSWSTTPPSGRRARRRTCSSSHPPCPVAPCSRPVSRAYVSTVLYSMYHLYQALVFLMYYYACSGLRLWVR